VSSNWWWRRHLSFLTYGANAAQQRNGTFRDELLTLNLSNTSNVQMNIRMKSRWNGYWNVLFSNFKNETFHLRIWFSNFFQVRIRISNLKCVMIGFRTFKLLELLKCFQVRIFKNSHFVFVTTMKRANPRSKELFCLCLQTWKLGTNSVLNYVGSLSRIVCRLLPIR
jgi:hypothetical protein